MTGVSEESEAVTGASEPHTDEASAANSAEGRFGFRAHAFGRPVGAQTRPKAAVKRAAKPPSECPGTRPRPR